MPKKTKFRNIYLSIAAIILAPLIHACSQGNTCSETGTGSTTCVNNRGQLTIQQSAEETPPGSTTTIRSTPTSPGLGSTTTPPQITEFATTQPESPGADQSSDHTQSPVAPQEIQSINIALSDANIAPGVYQPQGGWKSVHFNYNWTTITNYGKATGVECTTVGTIYSLPERTPVHVYPTRICSNEGGRVGVQRLPPSNYLLVVDVKLASGSHDSAEAKFTVIEPTN